MFGPNIPSFSPETQRLFDAINAMLDRWEYLERLKEAKLRERRLKREAKQKNGDGLLLSQKRAVA